MRGYAWIAAAVVAGALAFAPTAGAATAACTGPAPAGGDWPLYGHDYSNTRSQPDERLLTPARAAGLKPAWVFSTKSTGDGSSFESTPIVSGGCIFVGSTNGVAYAIDAATGKPVWHRQLSVPNPGLGGGLIGAPALTSDSVIFPVNETSAPYAIALSRANGNVLWRSAPIVTTNGDYTNGSAVTINGLVFLGYSEDESVSKTSGGFALIDASNGHIVKVTPTIPPADEAKGYGGGGIWSTPAFDPATGYAYIGAGNPSSRQVEHPHTNAILKIDLDRSRPTFGEIVASYKGNVDQYAQALQAASKTPVCAASDNPQLQWPLDDPACGQIDLDFGAPANLFTDSSGHQLVGELQKSGVYHVARADTMQPAWTSLLGGSCGACNAAPTAFDGSSIIAVSTPGGVEQSLTPDDGTVRWRSPTADGVHYQGVSTAAGVAYTIDGNGFLDVLDAATGATIVRRPISEDTGDLMPQLASGGLAIASHTVFVADTASDNTGFLIAYR
jgi:polyvinyl alcohol dehydrogenase (cytochrome)